MRKAKKFDKEAYVLYKLNENQKIATIKVGLLGETETTDFLAAKWCAIKMIRQVAAAPLNEVVGSRCSFQIFSKAQFIKPKESTFVGLHSD